MKKILVLLCLPILFLGCKKEGCTDVYATNYSPEAKRNDGSCIYQITPTADFLSVNSSDGWVEFTNYSANAIDHYWTFGDGTSSYSEHPSKKYYSNGVYDVTLRVQSIDGIYDQITKQVFISNISAPATTGQCLFWTSTTDYGTITVNVNGSNVGTVSSYSTTGLAPECGTVGFVTIDRPAGTYNVTATSSTGATWQFSITIQNGICIKRQFT